MIECGMAHAATLALFGGIGNARMDAQLELPNVFTDT